MMKVMSGNEAVAYAMKQIDPDVMGAFPITPSTDIPEIFAGFVANGEVNTEYVAVESEHSSMSVCIAAQAAGARAVSATSACGLALMHELLYVAASSRLPISLACVNRALTGPININHDYSDSMGSRDSGWIQIYAENNQEAYDNFIQAMPIGESPEVRLPVMTCMDGFITSHAMENIELLETAAVKAFVGEYRPEHFLLKKDNPLAIGPYDISAYYMEHKVQQAEAMKAAKARILEVAAQFEKVSGRKYGLIEEYCMEDAETAVVLIGSSAGTGKAAVNRLRSQRLRVILQPARTDLQHSLRPGQQLAGHLLPKASQRQLTSTLQTLQGGGVAASGQQRGTRVVLLQVVQGKGFIFLIKLVETVKVHLQPVAEKHLHRLSQQPLQVGQRQACWCDSALGRGRRRHHFC